MKADRHRQAALDDERAVADLGDPALKEYVRRLAIEAYWSASFHWIAYACQQKHGKHRDNHQGLVSYLRNDIAELSIADRWRARRPAQRGLVWQPAARNVSTASI